MVSEHKTILLVDDDAEAARAMAAHLKAAHAQWEVVTAASAEEAQKCYERFDQGFSALVIDGDLGHKLGGLRLARQLRQKHGTMPIVFTMKGEWGQRHQGLFEGLAKPRAVLEKPFPPGDLESELLSHFNAMRQPSAFRG